MTIVGRLALLFVIVPILELVLLIQIGQVVGLWPTVALVLLTGVTGAALARLEGMRVLFQFRRELASGRIPGQALLDGISVLIGGALLLTPGILTDVAGFALLLPVSRRWIQRRVRRRLERGVRDGTIRVVATGPGGLGWWGAAGAERSGAEPGSGAPRGLDPSKGIVIDRDDS